MKKTVLITGVAGLLGSRLADWIIKNQPDYRVIGIDDLSGGYEENIPRNVLFHNLDLVKQTQQLSSIFNYYILTK